MLSRVAENLYWIGRYVERAEHLTRLLEDAFHLELDSGPTEARMPRPLETLLDLFAVRDGFNEWRTDSGDDQPTREALLRFLTFSKSDGASIRSMIALARENARGTQDALSAEVWSQLNQFYLYLTSTKASANFQTSILRFFSRIQRECLLFGALIEAVLPRTEAFHFLQLGRHLERVDMLSRILASHCRRFGAGDDAPAGVDLAGGLFQWRGLLRSCAAYEACLQQSHARIEPRRVLRYLLLETGSPRSMRFGVGRCLESLRYLGSAGGSPYGSEAERQLGRLDGELRYADIDELIDRGIVPFLGHVLEISGEVSREVHQAYFRT